MKQIFTLFTAMAVLFTVQATAQTFSENFDGGISSANSNCWKFTTASEVNSSTNGTTPISVISIGMDALGTSNVSTPYFDLNGTTILSFKYKLSQKLNGNSTRTLQVGTTDVNGSFTVVSSATILFDKNNTPTTTQNFSATIPTSGIRRITVRSIGSIGDGQSFIMIDDLALQNTSLHYAPSYCNSAPVVSNENFSTLTVAAYSGNVLTNDYDPNAGETISATIATQPLATIGTVSMSSNGNFTFTPAPGFTGGPVTFTYSVKDNGYDPLTTTGTVTIIYPEVTVLPIQLLSFSGSLVNNQAQLKWSVGENETGNYFEIEKSLDGKNFSSIGVVMVSDKVGTENYTYTEASDLNGEAYYRLKIVNENKSTIQSRIIVLKNQKISASNSLQVLQNPVESSLAFNYTVSKASVSRVNIYNMSGVKVYSADLNAQAGSNTITFNLDNKLSSGTYVLEVVSNLERSVTKIIKK